MYSALCFKNCCVSKASFFKAVLNNNSVGNRQNQPSEIVGGYPVGSFGYFRGNELLEFIVAADKLCPDFLISEQSGVEQMKPQARVSDIPFNNIVDKTVRGGIFFLVFRPL